MGDDQKLGARNAARNCTVPGCTAQHYARGRCKYHYHKARREDPSGLAPTDWGKWRGKDCTTDGCREPAYSKGLCTACARRKSYADRKAAGKHYCSKKRSDAHLKMQYGITGVEYDRRFAAQGGVCHLCKEPPTECNTPTTWKVRKLAVDHCHKTGRVRALLCNACNLIVKKRNTPELLRRAADYLEHHARHDRIGDTSG